MLDIVARYHRIQFQGNFVIQTQENGKKPHFGPALSLLCPNSGHQFLFIKLAVRHCSNLSSYAIYKKTNEPNLRKWAKNLIWGPDFGLFCPNLDPKIIFRGFLHLLEVRNCRKPYCMQF